jgi:hypothetical protein
MKGLEPSTFCMARTVRMGDRHRLELTDRLIMWLCVLAE